ncbi:calcium-binding protein [Microvirga terrestris]|uniref:Calcium-binding protein n=1 Tax=Microvirga terrestris TaxID=2791024 RepID=A0ABS0HTG3_9HYPH|nr:calcium-binding protein [Microvirga terrestris]MBF9196674.1 hypothetical protein [Microvirga terrestris]
MTSGQENFDELSRLNAAGALAATPTPTAGNDTINGSDDADTIDGLAGHDTIYGHDGNDSLVGGEGNDVLDGGMGNDTLLGGDNYDDTLIGGVGADRLDGGTGNSYRDYVSYASATTGVVINLKNIAENTGDAFGDQYVDIEGYTGTNFNDLIIGNAGNPDGRKHFFSTGAGNDTVIGGSGHEAMDGGEGIDTVSYQLSDKGVSVSLNAGGGGVNDSQSDTWVNFENIIGTDYKDSLSGDAGDNYIKGGKGDDLLIGYGGNDTLDGGEGAEDLQGLSGNDTYIIDNAGDHIREASGNGWDTAVASTSYSLEYAEVEVLQAAAGTTPINLTGNEYTRVIVGNEGSNILHGKGGATRMEGGGGNDVYHVDNAGDQVVDSSGYDVVYASTTFTLSADSDIDFVYLTGSAASLTGNSRDNILLGTGAKNTLNGGAGHDRIYGKGGKDLVIGGSGNDKFIFDTKIAKSNTDTIKDFKSSADDLWLENSLFKSNKSLYASIKKGTESKPLKLKKAFFTLGDEAKDRDDFFVYNKKSGVLSYDKDGSGSAGMTEIAKLSNKTTLKYTDLLFI